MPAHACTENQIKVTKQRSMLNNSRSLYWLCWNTT